MADSSDTPKVPEMVERLCRAIHEAEGAPRTDEVWREIWAWHTSPHTISQGGTWQTMRAVEAVLAAISVPTDAMRAAALTALRHWAPIVDNDTILTKIYQAMIAAAREG